MSEQPRRQRILVVDDDPGLQHALARILGRRHEVLCASSPAEALSAAEKLRPHLAIVDIYMPEMNGFELMKSLRTIAELDVIVMTGDTAEPDANLIRAIDEGAFYFIQKPFERRVLLALVARCLELRRLRNERQQHIARLERELADARRFQESFLPPPVGRCGNLRIAARYLACQELAGDFYDYVFTPDGGVAMIVADVVGHGASAAMMTGIVKSAFHSTHGDGFAPAAVVAHLQSSLRVFEDSRFVTVFCARLHPARGMLTYTNAGHPPAMLRRRNGAVELLEGTGPLVCPALAEIPCLEASVAFGEGDCLFAYTDGLAEASGLVEMFGHARIRSVVAGSNLRGPALLERLFVDLAQFAGTPAYDDDVTALTLDMAAECR